MIRAERHRKRLRKVESLRAQGYTFAEIGRALEPEVSKQRAHQLYREAVRRA